MKKAKEACTSIGTVTARQPWVKKSPWRPHAELCRGPCNGMCEKCEIDARRKAVEEMKEKGK